MKRIIEEPPPPLCRRRLRTEKAWVASSWPQAGRSAFWTTWTTRHGELRPPAVQRRDAVEGFTGGVAQQPKSAEVSPKGIRPTTTSKGTGTEGCSRSGCFGPGRFASGDGCAAVPGPTTHGPEPVQHSGR